MSSCKLSTESINKLVAGAQLVRDGLSTILLSGRLDPPLLVTAATGPLNTFDVTALESCNGYAIPAGPGSLGLLLEVAASDVGITAESILKYSEFNVDYSLADYTLLNIINSAKDTLNDLREVQCESVNSSSKGYCISAEFFDSLKSKIAQSVNLLEQSQTGGLYKAYYGIETPCWQGNVGGIFVLPYAYVGKIGAEKEALRSITTVMASVTDISSVLYDCAQDPDVTESNDCQELIDAIENLELNCDLDSVKDLIVSVENNLWTRINEAKDEIIEEIRNLNFGDPFDYLRITNHIDSKFPELSGSIAFHPKCGEGDGGSFAYGGEGLRAINHQIHSLASAVNKMADNLCAFTQTAHEWSQQQINQHTDTKFPELSGALAWGQTCGVGSTGSFAYGGEGLRAINHQIHSLASVVQQLANNLCLHTNVVDSNMRKFVDDRYLFTVSAIDVQGDRTRNHVDTKFPELSGSIAWRQKCGVGDAGKFAYGGEGFRGINGQIHSLAAAVEKMADNLCLHAESQADEECVPLVIYPAERHDKEVLVSQLQLLWCEVGEKYGHGVSVWRTHIPNPRSIDWCTDLESLRWHRGNSVFGIIEWASGYGFSSRGYFDSEGTAQSFMSQMADFSLNKDPSPMIRITKGIKPKRPIANRTLYVARAAILEIENNQVVGKVCLAPPEDGC